jgi:hypothetical protein
MERLRRTRLERRTALRRPPIEPQRYLAASIAQRVKVATAECLVCGASPVDPAHLVPQRLGGCGLVECVLPLCRTHHRLFDTGQLALTRYLGPEHETELEHALCHVSESELADALAGGWPAPWD